MDSESWLENDMTSQVLLREYIEFVKTFFGKSLGTLVDPGRQGPSGILG
jgi:hypothetical protein